MVITITKKDKRKNNTPRQAEFSAMRRFVNSERTSEGTKKSFTQVLNKYNQPLIEPKKEKVEKRSEEYMQIESDIKELKELLEFADSEMKKDLTQQINELEDLKQYS